MNDLGKGTVTKIFINLSDDFPPADEFAVGVCGNLHLKVFEPYVGFVDISAEFHCVDHKIHVVLAKRRS